jgi:hypothetical protein
MDRRLNSPHQVLAAWTPGQSWCGCNQLTHGLEGQDQAAVAIDHDQNDGPTHGDGALDLGDWVSPESHASRVTKNSRRVPFKTKQHKPVLLPQTAPARVLWRLDVRVFHKNCHQFIEERIKR